MIQFGPDALPLLLPLACRWAEAEEGRIRAQGEPLDDGLRADAERIGVARADDVRVLSVSSIPSPQDPILAEAARATGFIGPETVGLCLRYGIYVRDDCGEQRPVVVHELVHTHQYERLGGFEPFLAQYLHECLTIGYPQAPLEQEALRIEREICGE